ncbi:MAG: HAD-IIA family hydrolase [Atopobiaceae bacterium]|jgi:HAD superfamily hydrolase (TIGR01450 family)|nr:HAD-IIA family hydrolase [Atopobiaceae bacterium]MCH4119120.1 HAD-IIA family hydrolase [Atopobiaceae bacterium]MCI1318117.1 HAD-IIA family hydrolase [Atopobiaceae bacterium]MCI1388621.1 HAD-IIA family hydrolase [Atopobiaceae bacterium]MCI1432120.1 HAD-IIA family hydrolase [Atopobiaceae bacterium]
MPTHDLLDHFGRDCSALLGKRLWLFDMDGTIYEGERVFDGTLDLLARIRERGGRSVFITNNSSKNVGDYVAKVGRMGIEATPEDFFTSVEATARYLKEHHPGERVYVQGTRSLVSELARLGIDDTAEEDPTATVVLIGFDTELTTEKLRSTCRMLNHDVAYLGCNPDLVCPTEYGFEPDCGSMAIALRNATGKYPHFIGKPEPDMIDIVREKFGATAAETVVVGDRLYTDIASGRNAGVDTVCVLSGEATLDDLATTEFVPTWVIDDVREVWRLLG